MRPQFIIVTDRGALRAGWVSPSPHNRPAQIEWVEDLAFVHPRQHFIEQVTDMSGAYSAAESSGSRGARTGQAPRRAPSSPSEIHWKIEADRRAVEDLGSGIARVLESQKPESWSLAVPADIHLLLLDKIPKVYQERLSRVVCKNLVRATQESLLEHFEIPEPIPPLDNRKEQKCV